MRDGPRLELRLALSSGLVPSSMSLHRRNQFLDELLIRCIEALQQRSGAGGRRATAGRVAPGTPLEQVRWLYVEGRRQSTDQAHGGAVGTDLAALQAAEVASADIYRLRQLFLREAALPQLCNASS